MSSQRGDYDELIRPVEAQMMRAVWRIAQNADDADDAFQDATATIWAKIARVRAHRNPQALILRICINAACDLVRKKSRRACRETPLTEAHVVADSSFDGTASLRAKEQRDMVARAIARLPERQAAAVTMRILLERPYSEIADALGCAEATARVHVSNGLQRLRSALDRLNAIPSEEDRR